MAIVMPGSRSPGEQPVAPVVPEGESDNPRILLCDELRFPNVTITDESNPIVNALQIGVDSSDPAPKGQHISAGDQVLSGPAPELTVNPGTAKGVNQPAAPLRLFSGISTGDQGGAPVVFGFARAGAAGEGQNAQADRFYMGDVVGFSSFQPAENGNAFLGISALRWRNAYIERVETGTSAGAPGELVVRSPNGTRWNLTVNDAGVIAAVAL